MADAKKRILLYQEKTTVDNTDYMLIDSSTTGTKKYQVTRILTEAEAAAQTKVDAEAEARAAADIELKADLKNINSTFRNGYITSQDFVQGQRLHPNYDLPNSSVLTRCTSANRFYLAVGDYITISNIDNGLMAGIQGSANETPVYDSSWKTDNFTYTVAEGKAGYYHVTVRNTGNTEITPNDIVTLTIIVGTAQYLYKLADATDRSLKGIGMTLSNTSQFVAPYDDCNTLPNETIVSIFENPVGYMANLPSGFTGGTILTMTSLPRDTIGMCQLAIDRNGQIYTRHKFGTWGAWKTYITSTENNDPLPELAMFPSIAVVGDSYASGGIYDGDIQGMFRTYSWPQVLSRLIGCTLKNYSNAGLSTRTWLSNPIGLTAALNDEPSALYLLCLGINDGSIYNSDPTYLGTIDDIKTDYSDNPDTFYGNYGRIVDQLKSHAPNAKFVFIAPCTYDTSSTTWNTFQTAIAEIATHYGIPCISGMADPYFSSTFFQTNKASGHPLAITYSGMAKAYKRQIELAIQNNATYFRDLH